MFSTPQHGVDEENQFPFPPGEGVRKSQFPLPRWEGLGKAVFSPSPGGRGSGGGGSPPQTLRTNPLQHPFKMFNDLIVPKTQHHKPVGAETGIPLPVIRCRFGMVPAIKFDHDFSLKRDEINDKGAYRLLPAELGASDLTFPEVLPEDAFHVGCIVAKFSGLVAEGMAWFHG